MDDIAIPSLPFITRDMVKYGSISKLELVCTTQCISSTTLKIRLFSREGISEFSHVNSNTGIQSTSRHLISDFPIMVSVVDAAATLIQGRAYATLSLAINGVTVYQLAAGYVYRQKGISYPVSLNNDIIPGRGGYRVVTGADAGAGSEVSDSVPGGQMWRLLWARISLTTDANAANRRVHLRIGGNINNSIDAFGSSDQVASTTRVYTFAHFGYIPDETDSTNILISIPSEIFLVGNESIGTATSNIQVGDNFGIADYGIEQLYEQDS